MDNKKEQVKPIYFQLYGYFLQDIQVSVIYECAIWEQYNATIDELSQISEKDYSNFKINPKRDHEWGDGRSFVDKDSYKMKLIGIVSRLEGEYGFGVLWKEGVPQTIVNQTQSQTQNTFVQVILDVQSRIEKEIDKYEKGSNERSFLEKVKDSLSSTKNLMELLALILKIAKQTGVSVDWLIKIFS